MPARSIVGGRPRLRGEGESGSVTADSSPSVEFSACAEYMLLAVGRADAPPPNKGRIMAKDKPLTAKSSIGAWLKHPAGGPLIRDLLTQAGVDERVLTPLKILPLQQLVTMSQGQM